jgi:hypothetical protein
MSDHLKLILNLVNIKVKVKMSLSKKLLMMLDLQKNEVNWDLFMENNDEILEV